MTTRNSLAVVAIVLASACGEHAGIVMTLRWTGAVEAMSRIRTGITVCDPGGTPCTTSLSIECPTSNPNCVRTVGIFVADESSRLDVRFELTSLDNPTASTCGSRVFDLEDDEVTVEIRAGMNPPPPVVSSCDGCDGPLEPCPL